MNTKSTTNGNTNHGDNSNMKNNKAATLTWILKYNRTPYPYSPLNAAKKDCEPKQPGYFDGNYFKQLKWKNYQDWGQLTEDVKHELIKLWHGDKRVEGIGCNAGWNGKFYFSMIDVDPKNFESLEAMEQAVAGWENRNPGISLCPRVRTQSGGYRYFIGFESISKNWGNTIQFTFTQGGEKPLGELMVGPGGLGIILGKGLKGDYLWDRNPCGDIPVFQSPESIGLYQVEKAIATSSKPVPSVYDMTDTPELAREALRCIPATQFDEDYPGWINIGMACHAAGLDFEDWDNWSQGSSKYTNSKETFNHWKSFKDGGGITPGTLFKFARDNGWQPQRNPLINSSKTNYQTSGTAALKPETQSNVVPFNRQQTQPNIEELETELRKIADQNLPKSKEKSEVLKLSKIFNYNPKEISEHLQLIKDESEEENDLETLKEELNQLLKNKKQFLNTKEYLPENLAVVGEFASRLCLRPEVALTALITATSSLLPVGSKIHLSGYTDFDQPMGIYAAIIAEPSQQKSPLINKIVLEPFLELYEEERQKYEQEMADYQVEMTDWKSVQNNPDPQPKPPEMKYPFATGLTQAGLRTRLDKQAKLGAGMLLLVDEFSGALRSTSKNHNIGLIEDLLSAYDGYGRFEALKDGFASENPECLLSLLGGIQPGVIQEFMNGNDTNGFWSRLTIVNQPVSPFLIPDNPPAKLILKPMLVDFYKKISKLPKLNLRLEPTAEKTFHRLNNEAELSRVNAKNQALASLWGKFRGKIGRYTALLHVIDQVWQYGTVKDSIVTTETLLKGAALATFYYNESQVLYANCTKGDLSKPLAAILDIAEKLKQPLAARVMQQKDREFAAMDVNDIRQMFSQLAQMGHGSVIGSGTRLKFLANFTQTVDSVDNCRQTVDSETTTTQGLQPIVDSVDKKIKISTEPNPLKPLDEQGTVGNSKNNETVENLSTVSTIPSNTHTTGDTASTVPSTVVYNAYSSEYSERSTLEPIPPSEPLDFDHIKEGEILFDSDGTPHKITEFDIRTNMWRTHRKGGYISRNDILQGKFHRATVEDVTKLIERTIKGKNKTQAQWLCDVYGGEPDSLMAKAIDTNPEELALIFEFDDWA